MLRKCFSSLVHVNDEAKTKKQINALVSHVVDSGVQVAVGKLCVGTDGALPWYLVFLTTIPFGFGLEVALLWVLSVQAPMESPLYAFFSNLHNHAGPLRRLC